MDNDTCGHPVLKVKTSDVTLCDFTFLPKLKDEMKGRHLNDFYELRLESTERINFYPTEWFDQVCLYREWQVHSATRCVLCEKLTSRRYLKY